MAKFKTLIKIRGAIPNICPRKWGQPTDSPLSSSFSSSGRPLSALAGSPATLSSQSQERGRWSRWLLFLPGAITFGLGTWQIIRRQQKIEMLEYRKRRLELEPIAWNSSSSSSPGENLSSLEFRKVICEGVFDESKSIYVGPRSRSISGVTENGYYVITPLVPITDNPERVQSPILVNRGWVPRNWRDKPVEASQDVEQSSNKMYHDVGENERSSWWKFWSKKPKHIKVFGSWSMTIA
uniref:SURF1-like protein n=1 Tax=Nelumbo nucifera TaxID=4432 RepID=A0A822ZDK9_NELNU|nr:TPA_asm: hypothetical protein HUJ06_015838 [Nelumbo nucifera]